MPPEFDKDFYHEHPDVKARTDEDIKTFRKEKEIHIEGKGVPKPVTSFVEASFPGLARSDLLYRNKRARLRLYRT